MDNKQFMDIVRSKYIQNGVMQIDKEKCTQCGQCIDNCPFKCWEMSKGQYPELKEEYDCFSCSNCKRVCPFTKPNNSWLHQMIRKIIEGRVGLLNNLMVYLDQSSGYGQQLQGEEFWKMNGQKTITARESM